MIKRIKLLCLAVTVIVCLTPLLMSTSLVYAAEDSSNKMSDSQNDISFEDQYLTIENNQFKIDERAKLDPKYGELYVMDYLNALETINSSIQDQGARIDPNTKTVILNASGTQLRSDGKNSISVQGALIYITLTKATSNAVLQGGIAGGATALGGLFGPPGAIAGSILGAVISSYTSGLFKHGTRWTINTATKYVQFIGYQ